MTDRKFNAKEAIRLIKGGYPIIAVIDRKKYAFSYTDNKVHVLSDNGGMTLSEPDFLSLYQDSLFYLDQEAMEEETVDIKKDEEYYSWRQ